MTNKLNPNNLDLSQPADQKPKEPYAIKLKLRFGKRCVECDTWVAAGEVGWWNKRTSEVFCEGCGSQLDYR